MIVYFSGTGNSRWCAQKFGKILGDEVLDAFSLMRSGERADLTSSTPWVFVTPTYAWRLPRIFRDFIADGRFRGSSDAYFVMTCGVEVGNPGPFLQQLCDEKGFCYRGVLEVVMPENYVAMFPVPDETAARAIVTAACPVVEGGAELVAQNRDFPALRGSFVDNLKSKVVNPGFYRLFVKAKKFTVSDDCTGCGKCAKVCVLNNIRLTEGKPRWGDHCTHCMACICRCPEAAIEYGTASKGKPRYLCPGDES